MKILKIKKKLCKKCINYLIGWTDQSDHSNWTVKSLFAIKM